MKLNRPWSINAFFVVYLGSQFLGAVFSGINVMRIASPQTKIVALVLGLVVIALFIGLGYKIFTGRAWARLLYAVIYIGGLVVALLPHANPYPNAESATVFWAQSVIQGVAVVLSFTPSANAWFRHLRNQKTVQLVVQPEVPEKHGHSG